MLRAQRSASVSPDLAARDNAETWLQLTHESYPTNSGCRRAYRPAHESMAGWQAELRAQSSEAIGVAPCAEIAEHHPARLEPENLPFNDSVK